RRGAVFRRRPVGLRWGPVVGGRAVGQSATRVRARVQLEVAPDERAARRERAEQDRERRDRLRSSRDHNVPPRRSPTWPAPIAGSMCRLAADFPFGATRNSTAPVTNAAPPAASAIVDIVAALFASSFSCFPWTPCGVFGHGDVGQSRFDAESF